MYRDINEARGEVISSKFIITQPNLKQNIHLLNTYFLDFYQKFFISVNSELEQKIQQLYKKLLICKEVFKNKLFQMEKKNFLEKEMNIYKSQNLYDSKIYDEKNKDLQKKFDSILEQNKTMTIELENLKEYEQKYNDLKWENEILQKRLELKQDTQNSYSNFDQSNDADTEDNFHNFMAKSKLMEKIDNLQTNNILETVIEEENSERQSSFKSILPKESIMSTMNNQRLRSIQLLPQIEYMPQKKIDEHKINKINSLLEKQNSLQEKINFIFNRQNNVFSLIQKKLELLNDKKIIQKVSDLKKKSSFFYPSNEGYLIEKKVIDQKYSNNITKTRKQNFINNLTSHSSFESEFSITQDKFNLKKQTTCNDDYKLSDNPKIEIEQLKFNLENLQNDIKEIKMKSCVKQKNQEEQIIPEDLTIFLYDYYVRNDMQKDNEKNFEQEQKNKNDLKLQLKRILKKSKELKNTKSSKQFQNFIETLLKIVEKNKKEGFNNIFQKLISLLIIFTKSNFSTINDTSFGKLQKLQVNKLIYFQQKIKLKSTYFSYQYLRFYQKQKIPCSLRTFQKIWFTLKKIQSCLK